MEPSSFPNGSDVKSPLHVVSEAYLTIVECPTGMVPIRRNSRRDQMTVQNIGQVINKDDQLEVIFLYLFLEQSCYIS
jgi:hypothetical protein